MSPAPRTLPAKPAPAGWPGWAVAAAVAVLAFGVRWGLAGGAVGVRGYRGYDDGVYFSSAVAFVHGLLPYRDFRLLHPPGSMLALTPFAALTTWTSDSDALVVARVAFMLVGAANAVLVTRIARRWGTTAMIAGGVLYAVSYAAAWAERITLLEPLGSLCLLGGVVLVLRGLDGLRAPGAGRGRAWVAVGGAVLGLGATVKIWGLVPLLVVLLWLLVTAGWRSAVRAGAGAAVALAVVLVPFALATGWDMLRMVVLDQLGRPHESHAGPEQWFGWITGTSATTDVTSAAAQLALLRTAVAIVLVAAAAAWIGRRGRLWVVLLVVQTGVLLVAPSAHQHYAAFPAPALVLVLAAGVSLVPHRGRAAVAVVVCAGAGALLATAASAAPRVAPFPVAEVRARLPDEGCVRADSPGVLAVLDVLSRDVGRGCELPVDLSGYVYDVGTRAPRAVPRTQDLAWQREALRYLTSGSSAVVVRGVGNGFSDRTLETLEEATTTVLDRPGVRVLVPAERP